MVSLYDEILEDDVPKRMKGESERRANQITSYGRINEDFVLFRILKKLYIYKKYDLIFSLTNKSSNISDGSESLDTMALSTLSHVANRVRKKLDEFVSDLKLSDPDVYLRLKGQVSELYSSIDDF